LSGIYNINLLYIPVGPSGVYLSGGLFVCVSSARTSIHIVDIKGERLPAMTGSCTAMRGAAKAEHPQVFFALQMRATPIFPLKLDFGAAPVGFSLAWGLITCSLQAR
jgi:hypothetical protein